MKDIFRSLPLLFLVAMLPGCSRKSSITEAGPSGSWTKVSGLQSFTNIVPSGSVLFAGGDGVFRSTDNGSTWANADSGLPSSGSYVIAEHSNVLLAGDQGSARNGFFVSTDGGASWAARDSGLGMNRVINCIMVDGSDVFAGTSASGMFKSTNDGTSWTHVDNVGIQDVYSFTAVGQNIFAGLNPDGVFKSTDAGTTWSAVNNGISQHVNGPIWIVSMAAFGDNLFAGVNGGNIFLSENHGASWVSIAVGIPIAPLSEVHVAVFDSTIVAGTDSGVFTSPDLGATWTDITDNLSHTGIAQLSVAGGVLYVETGDGQIWRRTL